MNRALTDDLGKFGKRWMVIAVNHNYWMALALLAKLALINFVFFFGNNFEVRPGIGHA